MKPKITCIIFKHFTQKLQIVLNTHYSLYTRLITTMVKKPKIKVSRPNKKNNVTKSDQLELAQTAKNSNEVEKDDDSININQMTPKKIISKIDSNTLASSYFSVSSKSGNDSTNKKVM